MRVPVSGTGIREDLAVTAEPPPAVGGAPKPRRRVIAAWRRAGTVRSVAADTVSPGAPRASGCSSGHEVGA